MDEHESNTEPNTSEVTRRTAASIANAVHDARGARMSGAERAGDRRRPIVVAAIAVAATAILTIGLTTSRGVAAGTEAAPSPQATGYLPSISDMMIATIQPRHERIWRAEQDGNWEFAAYELGNLHGAFDRLGHAHPIEHDVSFPDMIASVTDEPFKELRSAILSKDATAFTKAYADLTDACNSCHQALNHGVVEIRVPNRTSASDLNTNSTPRN
jgi:hypothetical protein